jgi:hypothetical protein
MAHEFASLLARSDRTYSIAPAGCGKTTAIAHAVAESDHGRQLILTHTHAGVDSLRKHLRSAGVPQRSYEVATIAGWSLRLATAYPLMSGLADNIPKRDTAWPDVYRAAWNLLQTSTARLILPASYSGVYVDEYQDCTCLQHNLILSLANMIPCRILGDHLQGIFGFDKSEPLVQWDHDVVNNFGELPCPSIPWRWQRKNEALGKWLTNVRQLLLEGKPIDLRTGPKIWIPVSPQSQISAEWKACMDLAKKDSGAVVAIHLWPGTCQKTASRLQGAYTFMETVDCEDLLTWAHDLEGSIGFARAAKVIDFAAKCMTKVGTMLKPIRTAFASGKLPSLKQMQSSPAMAEALLSVVGTADLHAVLSSMEEMTSIPDRSLYRKELWDEMKRTIRLHSEGQFTSLEDAAWAIRDHARQYGRPCAHRTVSRTLLVKGLEFDHAILLDAKMDRNNLYVALTRGSRSLTVLSKDAIVQNIEARG